MSTAPRPSFSDINTSRYIVEAVPAQIRELQKKLVELELAKARFRTELEVLVMTALAHNVPLCPVPGENGNAAGPGGADGAAIRVGASA